MPELGRHAWAELADELSARIIRGELKPGHRLVEVDIATEFGISRGPVRTALADLEKRGLAEAQGRRGLVVVEMTVQDVRELYAVRIALEEQAVRELATLETVPEYAELRDLVDRLEQAIATGDHTRATEADLAFHQGLCSTTGNSRLLRAWESLADQIRLVIGTLQSEDQALMAPLAADHRKILDALLGGTSDSAASLLHEHLVSTREAMVGRVERDSASYSPS